jgi:hypothetical protein
VNIQLLLAQQYHLQEESVVLNTSFVTYNGITFKPNAIVLFSFDVVYPVFCKISSIIRTGNEVILALNKLVTLYYDMLIVSKMRIALRICAT